MSKLLGALWGRTAWSQANRPVENSYVPLGVPSIWNHANRTQIWTPSRSKISTQKSRSNFWPVQSKVWTARCEHRDQLNFVRQRRSCMDAWLRSWKKRGRLRTWIYESCNDSLWLEMLRLDSSVWTEQKYWMVPYQQSVRSNFSTGWKFDKYCVNVA